MLRYRLDELGWYQFEMLVQSLLKAELGLAVETWGGPSDNGRDAYADGPLSFPDRGTASEGPFIFQVKFVEGANAAGARFEERLRKALRAECSAIHSRRAAGIWQDPKHYVLLTNAPLTPTLRATLREVLAEALPRSKVHFRGGGDICDLLDTHKAIAHSFPELLSLRDLSFLLSDVVNKEVLERSRAAIDLAREAAHYFVATSAYHNAYQLLTQYGFVVLDGPPEMGKTTIAHIIALLQVLRGWHAIDCRNPDDFFAGFEPERSQIFIIDDAFGRTEYDVSLGRQWERELSKLMPRVDDNHWIVFTSRTQVLLRALDDLDVSGAARIFPDPAKLIVNAADLSVEERARILYRHVRAVELSAPMREIVRSEARRIVLDRNFTPERMRLLAFTLASDDVRGATKAIISLKMQDIIRNPSKAMRRSFRSLEQQYRLVLIALLDCDRSGTLYRLSSSFGRLYGGSIGETLLGLVDDLLGVFLRPTQPVAPLGLNWYVQVDWIHPSFRDLVIDELSADDDLRRRFLRTASVTGIALASK